MVYVNGVPREWEATSKGIRIQYFLFLGNYTFFNVKQEDDIQRLNEKRIVFYNGALAVPHLPRGRRLANGIHKPSRYNPK